ncbi:MAG TPA: NAD(P)H-dependent glycerol-3-phosphate dehydrogenase, partial [Tepidiformaceae bacterium]|nr:NAD(P)H-dependent glycerol-3-phosphate dehydrogenase [Tepidiformaceae bacterium]
AAAVVASADPGAAQFWQQAVSGGTFRAYTSGDVIGVELAGALKNVVAIAAGVAWGLGFGANTVAAIMTRGLAEISRLGIALGAEASTFQGLAGIGDLSATCFSPLSRNRQLGELLAAGYSITEAQRSIGQAVEGRATAPVAVVLARRAHVEMPIAEHVTALLEGSESVIEAMGALLERPLTAEGQ